MWYHVSEANSYLAKTGAGIEDVDIKKKTFVWPLQKVTKLSITPFDFSMTIQAMTSEKLQFSLPAVFTIGPKDTQESLKKYAVLLTGDSDGQVRTQRGTVGTGRNHVQDIVKGIIEGETRSIVSNMTMEELFQNRRLFKNQVIECVQKELDQFGLTCYNANVRELQDTSESKYFESLSRKAHEGAQSQAQVDVATAQARSKQEIAKIHANTAVLETERNIERANAERKLNQRRIEIDLENNIQEVRAQRAAQEEDVKAQRDVEAKRADMEFEKQRATTLTKAKIDRDCAKEAADGKLYQEQQAANAERYRLEAEASAQLFQVTQSTEADYLKQTKAAEAAFIARKKEAEGICEYAKALKQLAEPLGGPDGLLRYLMMEKGIYQQMAESNAKAISGLQPRINVWNTGSGDADTMAPIRNLFQTLPPLFSTIHDQTGMTPPNWMVNMPAQNDEMSVEKAVAKQPALVNGHKEK